MKPMEKNDSSTSSSSSPHNTMNNSNSVQVNIDDFDDASKDDDDDAMQLLASSSSSSSTTTPVTPSNSILTKPTANSKSLRSSSSSSSSSAPSSIASCCVAPRHDGKRQAMLISAVTATIVFLSVISYIKNRGGVGADSSTINKNIVGDSIRVAGDQITLFSIGDWGRAGNENQVLVANQMGKYGIFAPPQAILSVGDNFYEGGVVSTTDPQFETTFRNVYSHPSLQTVPWYAIQGNHDMRQSVQAQVEYKGDHRWNMPDVNYTMKWHTTTTSTSGSSSSSCVSAVFLHTCPLIAEYRDPNSWDRAQWPQFGPNIDASDPTAQLAWMKVKVAEASRECNAVFVIGHHPLYTSGEHGDNHDLIALLKPILDENKVDSYIAGHDHTMAHLRKDSIDYILTGAGSRIRENSKKTPETLWYDDIAGFTIHSVNATHQLTSYIAGIDGAIVHQSLHKLRIKPRRM